MLLPHTRIATPCCSTTTALFSSSPIALTSSVVSSTTKARRPTTNAAETKRDQVTPISSTQDSHRSFLISKRSMILKEVRDAMQQNNVHTLIFLLEQQVHPLDIHLKIEEYEKIFHLISKFVKEQPQFDAERIYNIWKYAIEKDKVKPTLKLYSILFHGISNCSTIPIWDWIAETFAHAVSNFSKQKRTKQTNQIITFCFNQVLRICLKTNPNFCSQFFEQYKPLLPLDKISYSLMIQYFAKYSTNQDAISQLMEEMKSKNFELDAFYYNLLLKSIAERRDHSVDVLLGVYRQMVENEKIRPTVHTFHILLQGVRRSISFGNDLVLKIYKEMQSQGIQGDESIFNFFIQLLCKEGHFDIALQDILQKQLVFKFLPVHEDTLHIALKRVIKHRKYLLENKTVEQVLNYYLKPLLHLVVEEKKKKQEMLSECLNILKETQKLSVYSVPKSVDEKMEHLLQEYLK